MKYSCQLFTFILYESYRIGLNQCCVPLYNIIVNHVHAVIGASLEIKGYNIQVYVQERTVYMGINQHYSFNNNSMGEW